MTKPEFAGFHHFQHPEDGEPYGSFEVWYNDDSLGEGKQYEGWYWHCCFPGCLPDGEPTGPFPTAEGAYLDAMKD